MVCWGLTSASAINSDGALIFWHRDNNIELTCKYKVVVVRIFSIIVSA